MTWVCTPDNFSKNIVRYNTCINLQRNWIRSDYKMLILGFGVVGFVRREGKGGAGIPDRCSSQAKAGVSGEPCP